ncbi:MAG: polysaccharide deacetylase family protein [Actinomycetota bacterium]|nr:polysaccharide deacetylase family protein [Actinomycetota bacterium]
MRIPRTRLRTAALLLALAILTMVGSPAHARRAPTADPVGDAKGPLDLVVGTLASAGPKLRLVLRTGGSWGPRQLDASTGRSACVEIFRGVQSTPGSTLCVVGRDDSTRAALQFTRLSPTGQVLARRTITHGVRRPDTHSLTATLAPAQLELPVGAFRYRVITSWTGSPACSGAPPCIDASPDTGTITGTVQPPRVVGCAPAGPSYRLSGPGRRRRVALTFDDGPSAYTPSVLRVLRRFRVHATFFLVGREVGSHAGMVREELAQGNAVGDHTFDHANVSAGGSFAAGEMERAQVRIRQTSGYRPCLFRAPYGAVSSPSIAIARSQGMLTVGWNVDPRDWSRPGADAIARGVLETTRRESIVIMHDGGGPREETVAALPSIIRGLQARGYRLVTVPELLGLRPVYG